MTPEERIFSLRKEDYAAFQRRLLPTVPPETILGVPTPELREIARDLPDPQLFRQQLPYRFFEENQIHAFSLEREKNFDVVISQVEEFLPYIDNWATCDQLRPRCFSQNRDKLLPCIQRWLASPREYTVRFGLEMLMVHFLDDRFDPVFLSWAGNIRREEYYIRMMAAWYFATALAKQWEHTLPYITGYRLDPWVHNKAIQKSIESRRIADAQKAFLRRFRV